MAGASSNIPVEILSDETIFKGKWMGADRIKYRRKSNPQKPEGDPLKSDGDPSKSEEGMWEVAYRTSIPKEAAVDGVTVIPLLIDAERGRRSFVMIKREY